MDVLAILVALGCLMLVAYRGYSVILLAPLCALLAVILSGSFVQVLPMHTHVFMTKTVEFVRLYFPVFVLGAVFGKLIELTGAAASLSKAIVKIVGAHRAIPAIVISCGVLTYGGVSLFVVAFAVYPLAAALFREVGLPKRLIPGTLALGSFSFTMDALPGSPQIQNIIPTSFFGTTIYAAPILGILASIFVATLGLIYLEWNARKARRCGEGYGINHLNEPVVNTQTAPSLHPLAALIPLLCVAVSNKAMTVIIHRIYGENFDFSAVGMASLGILKVSSVASIWAIEVALIAGIGMTLLMGFNRISNVKLGLNQSIAGALLAIMNTASEYGFGAVISSLAGFSIIKSLIGNSFSNVLMNEAVSINILAGITGSASGGMGIALAAMGKQYLDAATAAGISPEVLHRVAAMASGGMDTLPHNGAVITLLAITGLTHKQSYKDIFAITVIKTLSVFVVIAIYSMTGLV